MVNDENRNRLLIMLCKNGEAVKKGKQRTQKELKWVKKMTGMGWFT